MANSTEKQDYIHWMEISESLGFDFSREIESYFNGDADLGGSPPVCDGITTEVSEAARLLSQSAKMHDVGHSGNFSMESVPAPSTLFESAGSPSKQKSPRIKAAQPTVSKDNYDKKQNESNVDSSNVLGLDWMAPAPAADDTRETRKAPETVEKPQREKPVEKKQIAAERKTESSKGISNGPEIDLLGWGVDALDPDETKSIEAIPKISDTSPPTHKKANADSRVVKESKIDEKQKRRPEPARNHAAEDQKSGRSDQQSEKPKQQSTDSQSMSQPIAKSAVTDFFGAGLVDPPVAIHTQDRDVPHSPVRESSRKPRREAKFETTEQVDPLGFFDSPPGESRQVNASDNDPDLDSLDVDVIETTEDVVLESAWDEDFVEFEIEDLDPNASRESGNRNRESRDKRSAKREKPVRGDFASPGATSADADLEMPDAEETRSNDPEHDGATRTGTRSSRRRKPRGRRKPEDRQSSERQQTSKPLVDAPSSKKPVSQPKPRPVADQENDFDDDDNDDFDGADSRAETQPTKPRNLPTWNETVDVIVQSNISSRKKQPPRRRRGGSGSQGGESRQR